MGRVDLHVHSTFSDGLKTPSELCALADRLGMEWLSLCDHDTVDGLVSMEQAALAVSRAREGRGQPPLSLLPGVEISTGPSGHVHLLAYGASPQNARLTALLAEISSDRRARAVQMLDRLERAGVAVIPEMRALPDVPSVGRAHFARALIRGGAVRTIEQAFDRYLGEGRAAYVPRSVLSTGDTIAALAAMDLVPVLAHPMRMAIDREALRALVREWKSRGLRGLEAYHPSAGRRNARALELLARAEGLLVTGGSDYHGDANTRSHMGRLPAGWHSQSADLQALIDAVGKRAMQKERQDV